MLPVNPHAVPLDAYRRRRDAAARCAPHEDGRRDSHGHRRPYGHEPDPDVADALHALREVWRNPDVTPEQRAAIELAAQSLAATRGGRWAA